MTVPHVEVAIITENNKLLPRPLKTKGDIGSLFELAWHHAS
jgi:hypothetical protein